MHEAPLESHGALYMSTNDCQLGYLVLRRRQCTHHRSDHGIHDLLRCEAHGLDLLLVGDLATLDVLHDHDPLGPCYFRVNFGYVDLVPQLGRVSQESSALLGIVRFVQEVCFQTHLLGDVVRPRKKSSSASSILFISPRVSSHKGHYVKTNGMSAIDGRSRARPALTRHIEQFLGQTTQKTVTPQIPLDLFPNGGFLDLHISPTISAQLHMARGSRFH